MRTLPASLKSRFYIDGHFSPIKVFSPEEAAQVYQDYRQYIARLGTEGRLEGDGRFRVHLLAGWAARIVSHPVLVSAVKTVLETENVLVWSSDLCIKPPVSRGEFCWHQDSTYSGLQPSNRVVTAWLALTPSNLNSGSLSVISGSQAESGTAGSEITRTLTVTAGQVVRWSGIENIRDGWDHATKIIDTARCNQKGVSYFLLCLQKLRRHMLERI